jgi:hypothetical protein
LKTTKRVILGEKLEWKPMHYNSSTLRYMWSYYPIFLALPSFDSTYFQPTC